MLHVSSFMNWYQTLPLHINPIAFTIGSFAVRWYSLAYILGFAMVYALLSWRIRREPQCIKNISRDPKTIINSTSVLDFLLIEFFAILIGGRLGYVFLYDWSYYRAHLLEAFVPMQQNSGAFMGFFGMSYHGALAGVLIGAYMFCARRKINFLRWADFVAPAVPAGYFFGRIGNFLNGELYGRVTDVFWGMRFQSDAMHLRHPSQLYEALLEGLLLFCILWAMRNKRHAPGYVFGLYLLGYAVIRIFVEQFRQPDPQLGFIIGAVTLGQILSLCMGIAAVIFMLQKDRCKNM